MITTETATIATPLGAETRIKYTWSNALGQVVKVDDAEAIPVTYRYNAQGKLVETIVDNNADTTISIDYDIAGNKIYMIWNYN